MVTTHYLARGSAHTASSSVKSDWRSNSRAYRRALRCKLLARGARAVQRKVRAINLTGSLQITSTDDLVLGCDW